MAEFEQHLTIEQLSSFLDGELPVGEQKSIEQHLALCQRCQRHLAELRLTVQLLHALPQPVLPRSFVLPLDTIIAHSAPLQITSLPTISKVQRPAPPAYIRPLRVLSTLAAVFGIAFLLSAVLPLFLFSSGGSTYSTASSGSAAMPAKAPESHFNDEQLTQLAINPHAVEKPSASAATQIPSTPPPVYQPAQSDTQPVDTSPPIIFTIFDLSTFQGRAAVGFLLLLLGILGLIFFKRPRKA